MTEDDIEKINTYAASMYLDFRGVCAATISYQLAMEM